MTDDAHPVRVRVDRERCAGHGVCLIHAPAIFDLDEDGLSIVVSDTTSDTESARRAEANCPERAITTEVDS